MRTVRLSNGQVVPSGTTVTFGNGRGKPGLTAGDGYRFGKGLVAGLVVGTIWVAVPVIAIGLAFEVPAKIRQWREEQRV